MGKKNLMLILFFVSMCPAFVMGQAVNKVFPDTIMSETETRMQFSQKNLDEQISWFCKDSVESLVNKDTFKNAKKNKIIEVHCDSQEIHVGNETYLCRFFDTGSGIQRWIIEVYKKNKDNYLLSAKGVFALINRRCLKIVAQYDSSERKIVFYGHYVDFEKSDQRNIFDKIEYIGSWQIDDKKE